MEPWGTPKSSEAIYGDVLFPVRQVRTKQIQGCTTNAEGMLKASEENFVVYCIKGCREVQKQKDRMVVFIEGRLVDVEQIVC